MIHGAGPLTQLAIVVSSGFGRCSVFASWELSGGCVVEETWLLTGGPLLGGCPFFSWILLSQPLSETG